MGPMLLVEEHGHDIKLFLLNNFACIQVIKVEPPEMGWTKISVQPVGFHDVLR